VSVLRIASILSFPLRIPFRRPFRHHLREHTASHPLLVQVTLSDGTVGWGEAQPRTYVTGETVASAHETIDHVWGRPLIGCAISLDAAASLLRHFDFGAQPAAFCGLELALLDAAGRAEGRSVLDVIGGAARRELTFDGAVLGLLPDALFGVALTRVRSAGKRVIKIKAGLPNDVARVAAARRILGPDMTIVIDANAAWTAEEAIVRIRALEPLGVALVEQPVAKEDIAGLRRVRDAVATPIMADESLCTPADAAALLDHDAVDAWNIRLGKCGGLLASRQLVLRARTAGIACQLGTMVGESGILAAAGRLFAAAHADLFHLELDTSGNTTSTIVRDHLMKGDRVGVDPHLPGLGFVLDEDAVDRLRAGEVAA
jgi:muconate cycloisomerase